MIGLGILPFAIASNLMEKVGLGQSMLIAAGGMAVFYVGYVVQPGIPARFRNGERSRV